MYRRPGISFETAVPPLPLTLPRMDIAAFVGFATRGPINVPVPVEDVVRFRDIFGPPLELVRELESGRTRTAHLNRSVAAFFRNGGRRCWVVRVANPAGEVRRTSFGVPGLVSAETGRPSTMRARCYGATFDSLRVGTILHRRLLPEPEAVGPVEDEGIEHAFTISWDIGRPHSPMEDELTEGDLLRLQMESTTGPITAFATVASRIHAGRTEDGLPTGTSLKVTTTAAHLFVSAPALLSTPEGGDAEPGESTDVDVTVEVQAPSGPAGPPRSALLRRASGADEDSAFRLVVEVDEEAGEVGNGASRLEDEIVHVRTAAGNRIGWVQLGSITRRAGENSVEIEVRDALWPVPPDEVFTAPEFPTIDTIERLRFDVLAWEKRELHTRLDDLGFAEAHPRGWTNLPTDDDLFELREGELVRPVPGTLRADVFDPRFPFASSESSEDGLFLPLGMVDRPNPEHTRGRVSSSEDLSRLERERVKLFSPAAFVDPDLVEISTANLAEAADRKVYIEEKPASGLHSLWPIREVTLLAVPDAVHRGWSGPHQITPTPRSTPYLPAPVVDREGDTPRVQLSWAVDRLEEDDVQVEVQEAAGPAFDDPAVIYRGSDASVDRFVRSDDPATLYFRFRIVVGNTPGAWSNPRRADVRAQDFTACTGRPGVVDLELVDPALLRWEPLEVPAESDLEYEIQVDTTPTFDAPAVDTVAAPDLPLGPTPPDVDVAPGPTDYHWYGLTQDPEAPPIRYVRVGARRHSGSQVLFGGWSRTVAIVRPLEQKMSLVSTAEYDDPRPDTPGNGREGLLEVHKAMLRFCGARGDAVAVLALPEHDQPEEVRGHVARLRTPGTVLGYDEGKTLSYGALYYPWLLGAVEDGPRLVPAPPDGAACGMIAGRTLRHGAWIAPANIPLASAHIVVPPLSSGERADLERHNVNVFAPEAGDVVTLGAATLARDPDLEPIGTRRLLILVRRLVHREAPRLVFETHNRHLRLRIVEQFDKVLRRLFRQGAFAGTTPPEGYRVVADDSVNSPEAVERGRLVVELRLAPSRPLKFLTVRLVQRGGQPPMIAESSAAAPR